MEGNNMADETAKDRSQCSQTAALIKRRIQGDDMKQYTVVANPRHGCFKYTTSSTSTEQAIS